MATDLGASGNLRSSRSTARPVEIVDVGDAYICQRIIVAIIVQRSLPIRPDHDEVRAAWACANKWAQPSTCLLLRDHEHAEVEQDG